MLQPRQNDYINTTPKMSGKKAKLVTRVADIFHGQIDKDVIELILEESHWKEDVAIEKLYQLTSDEASTRRQSDCTGLDIIACTLLESEDNADAHGQTADTRSSVSNSGRQHSFVDGTAKAETRDTKGLRYDYAEMARSLNVPFPGISFGLGGFSDHGQPVQSGQWNSRIDSHNESQQSDSTYTASTVTDKTFSGAQGQHTPSWEDTHHLIDPPGLESQSKCISSSFERKSVKQQSEKLPDVLLFDTVNTAAPSVETVESYSALHTGACETGSLRSTCQSGKNSGTSFDNLSIMALSADAPEFRPSFLSTPSLASSALGSSQHFVVPKYSLYKREAHSVVGGTINDGRREHLPAYRPESQVAHTLGIRHPHETKNKPVFSQSNKFDRYVGQNLYLSSHPASSSGPGIGIWSPYSSAAATDSSSATTRQQSSSSAWSESVESQSGNGSYTAPQGQFAEKVRQGGAVRQGPAQTAKGARAKSQSKGLMPEKTELDGQTKVVIILRGLPGSGKSYLARKIQGSGQIFSTDEYFFRGGVYQFCPEKLSEAHGWNRKRVLKALDAGVSPVIVDNTNTELWEMLPYGEMAISRGYTVELMEPDTPWKSRPKHLAKVNEHGVSIEAIKRMKDRYKTISTAAFVNMVKNKLGTKNQPQGMSPTERSSPAVPLQGVKQNVPNSGQNMVHHHPDQTPMGKAKPTGKLQHHRHRKSKEKLPVGRQHKQKAKEELIGIRDYCLKLQAGGAKEDDIDAWIFVANLTPEEEQLVKEDLKKFKDNKIVDSIEKYFENSGRICGEYVYDSNSSRGASFGNLSEANRNSGQDAALISRVKSQSTCARNTSESSISKTDSEAWEAPQSQRKKKRAGNSVPEPQRKSVSRTNSATENKDATDAHTISWDLSLPQRGQEEKGPRSLKAKDSEEEYSQNSMEFGSKTENIGSWQSWKSTDSDKLESLWNSQSAAELLPTLELVNKTEPSVADIWSLPSNPKQTGNQEIFKKTEVPGRTLMLNQDEADSVGEMEEVSTTLELLCGTNANSERSWAARTDSLGAGHADEKNGTCAGRRTSAMLESQRIPEREESSVTDCRGTSVSDTLESESGSADMEEMKKSCINIDPSLSNSPAEVNPGHVEELKLTNLNEEFNREPILDTSETSRDSSVEPNMENKMVDNSRDSSMESNTENKMPDNSRDSSVEPNTENKMTDSSRDSSVEPNTENKMTDNSRDSSVEPITENKMPDNSRDSSVEPSIEKKMTDSRDSNVEPNTEDKITDSSRDSSVEPNTENKMTDNSRDSSVEPSTEDKMTDSSRDSSMEPNTENKMTDNSRDSNVEPNTENKMTDNSRDSSVEPNTENKMTDNSRDSSVEPRNPESNEARESKTDSSDTCDSSEYETIDSDVWSEAEEVLPQDTEVSKSSQAGHAEKSEAESLSHCFEDTGAQDEKTQLSGIQDSGPSPSPDVEGTCQHVKSLSVEEEGMLLSSLQAEEEVDPVTPLAEAEAECEPGKAADLEEKTESSEVDEQKHGEQSKSEVSIEASQTLQCTEPKEEGETHVSSQAESATYHDDTQGAVLGKHQVPKPDLLAAIMPDCTQDSIHLRENGEVSGCVSSLVSDQQTAERQSDNGVLLNTTAQNEHFLTDPSLELLSSTENSRSASPVIRNLTGRSTELSDSSDSASPSRRRRKKHRPQHLPFFEDCVKVHLKSDSWKNFEPEKQITGADPDRENNAHEGQDSLNRVEAQLSNSGEGKDNRIDSTTQTEGIDFAMVLKGTADLEGDYVVLVANSHYQCSEKMDINTWCRQKNTCDKSTLVDISEEPSVDQMYSLFPEVAQAHLNEVLEVCDGNVSMAIDLMFEWGITNPITPHDKHHLSKKTSHMTTDTVDTSGKDAQNSPSQLQDICIKLVQRSLADSKMIQQFVINSSEQRLQRIESSEYHRLRSLSCEGSEGSLVGANLPQDVSLSDFTSSGTQSHRFAWLQHCIPEAWSSESSTEPSEIGSVSELPSGSAEDDKLERGHVDSRGNGMPLSDSLHRIAAAYSDAQDSAEPEERRSQPVVEGDLTLSLPASLVSSLEQLFGPLPTAGRGTSSSCTIELDHRMAFNLYQCLSQSLGAQHVTPEEDRERQLREDEALAQLLQEEEEVDQTLRSIAVAAADSPPPFHTHPSQYHHSGRSMVQTQAASVVSRSHRQPAQLKDIMREEMAKQQQMEKNAKRLQATGDHIAIATKLKREKLQQHFPGLDEGVLEEIFQANGYCLETTVRVISGALGEKRPVSHKLEMAKVMDEENSTIEAVKQLSLLQATQEGSEQFQRVDAFSQPDQDYQEIRQEALLHSYMRKECFQKAHDAHRRGMRDVANFYSQQGRAHFEKMKEANMRASERLLESRHERLQQEMTLDLHGFHVEEAIKILKRVIEEKEKEFHQKPVRNRHYLFVITGRGKHSQKGVSRLRPALIAHLESTDYRYSEINPGLFRVYLRLPS
ncbi:uncharacterized protein LOC143298872 [Babylonia areolata]|uniref:uncharacterized protein LOC143298872 n=1 Tax=Babylonia areolata TaxID=304850 RepID=UPI003FD4102C